MIRTLKRLGYRFAMVSGGFTQTTNRIAEDLVFHFARANELEAVDGKLTGRVVGEVIDHVGKADALRWFPDQVDVTEKSVIAIGDGANDLDIPNDAGPRI